MGVTVYVLKSVFITLLIVIAVCLYDDWRRKRSVVIRTEMKDCPPDLWRHGKVMGMLGDVCSEVVEVYVKRLRKKSGVEKIDWHWVGGRALIRALGTPDELREIDKVMYWNFDKSSLQGLPGHSRGGYHPDGENHWTTQGGDDAVFIVAALQDAQGE